jgi:carboxylate-amine ligase
LDELGSRKEVEFIHEILRIGSGADRQLKVFEETKSMKAVVDYIVSESKIGL